MATQDLTELAPDPSRLDVVGVLLASHPGCAVGVFDRASNLVDAGVVLGDLGIPLDQHAVLAGGALVEFVAPADAWLVSDAATAAALNGSSARMVQLRDGRLAELHFVELGADNAQSVAIIVPGAGHRMAATPPATATVASPRGGIVRTDGFGTVVSAAPSALALLGRDPSDLLDGTPIVHIVHPDDHESGIVNWVAAKEQRGVPLRWRCRLVRTDGATLWAEVTMTNNIDSSGGGDVTVELYDISSEMAMTDALAAEKALLGLLTETLPVGVAKFDVHGDIEHLNDRLAHLLAPDVPQDVFTRAVRGELSELHLSTAFRELLDQGVAGHAVVEHGVAGTERPAYHEWTLRPVIADSGEVTGGVVCVADVTEATNLRAALEHRATTDALTGCLNRAGSVTAIEHALACATPDEGVGLLFIDLDRFKLINDEQGHAVGDAVLEVVAGRLMSAARQGDLVGRLGGDEFVVIAPGVPTSAAALDLAQRMALQLRGVAVIGERSVGIGASVGVAWSSSGSASQLLAAADAAMYAAKQRPAGPPVLAG